MRAWCACGLLVMSCSLERVAFKLAVDAAAPSQIGQIFLFVPYVALHLLNCIVLSILASLASCCRKQDHKPILPKSAHGDTAGSCCLDEDSQVSWQSMLSVAALDNLHLTLLFASAARTPGIVTINLIYLARILMNSQLTDSSNKVTSPLYAQQSDQEILLREEEKEEVQQQQDQRRNSQRHRQRRRYSKQKVQRALNLMILFIIFGPRIIRIILYQKSDDYNQLFASCIYLMSFLPLHASTVIKERSLISVTKSISRLQLNRNLALWQLAFASLLFPWIYVLLTKLNAQTQHMPSLAVTICTAWYSIFGFGSISWNLKDLRQRAPFLFLSQVILGSTAELFQTIAIRLDFAPLHEAITSAVSLLLAVFLLPLFTASIPPMTDILAAVLLCVRLLAECYNDDYPSQRCYS